MLKFFSFQLKDMDDRPPCVRLRLFYTATAALPLPLPKRYRSLPPLRLPLLLLLLLLLPKTSDLLSGLLCAASSTIMSSTVQGALLVAVGFGAGIGQDLPRKYREAHLLMCFTTFAIGCSRT